jgi:hypothetical protein
MRDDRRLSYPMPYSRALRFGLIWGLILAAGNLLSGRLGASVLLFVPFTLAGLVLGRSVLRTVVHSKGFVIGGFQEFDWADVADATVASGKLCMKLRNGGPSELPQSIIEDHNFRDAIGEWLPTEHPVRRAISS